MYFLCECGKMVDFTPETTTDNIEEVRCPVCKQLYYYLKHAQCLSKAGSMNDIRKAWRR